MLLAAGCGATRTVVRTVTVTPDAASAVRWYGHVVSIEKSGDGYLVRYDPAWLLSGLTANVQQAVDQGQTCDPVACPPVANDNLVDDESHATITFRLPASTRGTVLTSGGNLKGTPVSADQLAAIVNGTSATKLFEPLDSGVWLTVHIDTVTAFQQQYRP
ncbi:MAG TPA: hypothetical protein VHD91_05715 [Gaiellaceae bacterium]|nr:hypothetical protein [Gaiellaceae bacterium]